MYRIYDAKGVPIGNPKGYKSVSSALSVVNNPRTKVYKHLADQPHIAHKTIWAIRPTNG